LNGGASCITSFENVDTGHGNSSRNCQKLNMNSHTALQARVHDYEQSQLNWEIRRANEEDSALDAAEASAEADVEGAGLAKGSDGEVQGGTDMDTDDEGEEGS
jgi:hypothetical protein